MFRDNELILATAHSPSTSTATAAVNLSTNVWDSGPLGQLGGAVGGTNLIRDLGTGQQLYLHVLCTVAALSATSTGTIEFRLITDSVAGMTTSPTTMASTGALGTATQTIGVETIVAIPPGAFEEFVGVSAFIVGVALTAGTWAYWIDTSIQSNRAYAGGFNLDV